MDWLLAHAEDVHLDEPLAAPEGLSLLCIFASILMVRIGQATPWLARQHQQLPARRVRAVLMCEIANGCMHAVEATAEEQQAMSLYCVEWVHTTSPVTG